MLQVSDCFIAFFVGFVLEGFDLPCSRDSLQSVIHSTTELLPESKPRFIHGPHLPGWSALSHSSASVSLTNCLSLPCLAGDIFAAVECGVDVFDGSYVYTATERGCALTYPNQKTPAVKSDTESRTASNKELLPFELDLNESR